MTRAELLSCLIAAKWPVMPRLLDDVYDPLSLAFVEEAWTAAVAALPPALQTRVDLGNGVVVTQPRYIPGVFNCNKQSRWLAVFVDIFCANDAATKGTTRNSPALGPLSYLIGGKPANGHDIDWFVDYTGAVHYFEKQTGNEVTLSSVEVASFFFEEAA